MAYALSIIKSIQNLSGSVNATSASTASNVTITSVDTNKAVVLNGNRSGYPGSAAAIAAIVGTTRITSATNVEINRMGTGSGYPQTVNYAFQVVEFF